MSPKNATIGGDGFRIYPWPGGDTPLHHKYNATEPTDLLSVTSIRTLNGEPFQLVNWKISNVVNLAMGVRKQVRIGPRGGVKEVYVKDGPFPGEFVVRMQETEGNEKKLDDLRKWLRETADEPRDIAAVRGSVVHKLIEVNASMTRVNDQMIRLYFDRQWKDEKRRVAPDVTDEDVHFVENAMRQYWDMRVHRPFVVLAQEVQVYALKAGYAGTFDVLIWFLPEGSTDEDMLRWQKAAYEGKVTIEIIEKVGGELALGDWKTAKGIYTNHVTQLTAYLASEFVATDGVIDERLTELLLATMKGALFHIRPNGWKIDRFDFRPDALRAFLGSVAHARFLAFNKTPTALFTSQEEGVAPDTDDSDIADESE